MVASGEAVIAYAERIALYGKGVRAEAVRALCIIGIELCGVVQVAITYNKTIVQTNVILALEPLIYGIEDRFGVCTLIIGKYKISGTI